MIALVLAMIAAITVACDSNKYTEPFNDSGRGKEFSQPADVITMPDGFGNAATKCIPGTKIRIATLYHSDGAYGSIAMITDESCPK